MKRFLILFLLLYGITSCSKHSLDQEIDGLSSIEKSEIFVTVSYLSWVDSSCEPGCAVATSQMVTPIPGAIVEIYSGAWNDSDHIDQPLEVILTDKKGCVLFPSIEPGQYTLFVDTPLGQKKRILYTQLNRRTSIDFSF